MLLDGRTRKKKKKKKHVLLLASNGIAVFFFIFAVEAFFHYGASGKLLARLRRALHIRTRYIKHWVRYLYTLGPMPAAVSGTRVSTRVTNLGQLGLALLGLLGLYGYTDACRGKQACTALSQLLHTLNYETITLCP